VVLLVEHQQAEPAADPGHVNAGAVVGRDGDGADAEHVVADDAGVVAEPFEDSAVPLVHEVADRGDHERRDLGLGHDREGHLRLARAGGHHDDAVARGEPGIQGGPLLGPERVDSDLGPAHGPPSGHAILDRRLRLSQAGED
jgi:hypothetical protein